MNLIRTVRLALTSLTRNRLRSFLMMLGVTIGIASLAALASVGEATKQETMRQFKRMLGTFDMVIIMPGAPSTRGSPSVETAEVTLTSADAKAIAAEVPGVRQVAEMLFDRSIEVKYREKSETASVVGVSPNWFDVRGEEIAAGEGITEDDVASLVRMAVIGLDVRVALFPDQDPIGQTIRIGDVPFQVKGVLAKHGVGPGGASMDNFLVIPLSTASKRLFNRDYLTSVFAQLEDPARFARAMADITTLLRERHGIIPPAADDFWVVSPQVQLAQIANMGSTLSRVLIGVAVIATLIGGTVIMSLMLIAVSERRKEIGVRRAVGASRSNILIQFLVEAAVISLIGGLLGIALGVGGTFLVMMLAHLPPAIRWDAVGGAALLSVAVGLVFGLQPAWRASNVDPIAALRS